MVLGHPGWREMSKTPLAALQTRIGPAWPEDARSSSAKRRVAGWVARGCWDYFYDSYYRSFPHSPKKAPLSLLVGGAITILKIICVYIYICTILFWLVADPPLWKMMDFVSRDDYVFPIYGKSWNSCTKPPTSDASILFWLAVRQQSWKIWVHQWEGLSHILWKIRNVGNHQPVFVVGELHHFFIRFTRWSASLVADLACNSNN